MSGELEFFARCENAQSRQRFILGRFLHENCFREVHLSRDGQHCGIGKSIAIRDDCKRIAFKSRGGKNIKGVEGAFHEDACLAQEPVSDALELGDSPFVSDVTCIQRRLLRYRSRTTCVTALSTVRVVSGLEVSE